MTHNERVTHPGIVMLRDVADTSTPGGRIAAWIGIRTGMRPNPLVTGLLRLAEHNTEGHEAYLMGMHSTTGWWYYFPVAFAVKTPVATLLAIGLALGIALSARARPSRLQWMLAAPILAYLPLCLSTNINTGARHLLPLYPFL